MARRHVIHARLLTPQKIFDRKTSIARPTFSDFFKRRARDKHLPQVKTFDMGASVLRIALSQVT